MAFFLALAHLIIAAKLYDLVYADEKREIFECLGKPVLPVSYLVQRKAGKRKIRLI